jgi:hypothetical protein
MKSESGRCHGQFLNDTAATELEATMNRQGGMPREVRKLGRIQKHNFHLALQFHE